MCVADMTEPQPRMIPSTADAPTLTLAASVLLASEFPKAYTPEQRQVLAAKAVDLVMVLWDEIMTRILAGALTQPAE